MFYEIQKFSLKFEVLFTQVKVNKCNSTIKMRVSWHGHLIIKKKECTPSRLFQIFWSPNQKKTPNGFSPQSTQIQTLRACLELIREKKGKEKNVWRKIVHGKIIFLPFFSF